MKKLCLKNVEIGSLISGRPHNRYEVPRGKWQETFQQFLSDCGFDNYGHIENDELEKYLEIEKGEAYYPRTTTLTPEFIMENGLFSHIGLNRDDEFYFYRGNLYCIYRDHEDAYYDDEKKWSDEYDKQFDLFLDRKTDWEDEHHIDDCDDDRLPPEILKLKPSMDQRPDPNNYRTIDKVNLVTAKFEHNHYFDNKTFVLRPYYWGDAEYICNQPNFIYYPKDIEISWYKYPLRGASCNKNLSYRQFTEILEECKKSL